MASSYTWSYPAPSYRSILTYSGTELDSPGRRCGHTLTPVFVENSHRLVLFGGTTVAETSASPGAMLQGATNSVHCFDVSTGRWTRIYPRGNGPSPRAGHAATSFGSLVAIQGGIGPSGICPGDLYLLDTSSANLMWYRVEAKEDRTPGPRYGHAMAFVANKLIVFGGSNGDSVYSDTWALDTTHESFAWDLLPPYGHVPSARMYCSASVRDDGIFVICGGRDYARRTMEDTYELRPDGKGRWIWTRLLHVTPSPRYQHTSVFIGPRLHVIGGVQSQHRLVDGDVTAIVLNTVSGHWLGRDILMNSTSNNYYVHYQNVLMRRCRHASASIGNFSYVHGGLRDGTLLGDLLVAEDSYSQQPSTSSLPPTPYFVRRYEYENLRPPPSQIPQVTNIVTRRESTEELRKKVFSTLLRPKDWKPPTSREFFLTYNEIVELCDVAEQRIMKEPTVLQLKSPIKVFGDLHGQFGDLMRLFKEFQSPSIEGDITYIDYLFLGDYVDRGQHSLEIITLLLALKIEYPENVHMIRGNHESEDMNKIYGLYTECKERMGDFGDAAYNRINRLFSFLPLAALIEKKIFCVHGGIGQSVLTIEQVMNIERPIFYMPESSDVIRDILWSDPTKNDSVLGIASNTRGPSIVAFGPDIVKQFCERNNIELILRGHECVLDGFERFAGGKLITVFSATNYCGNSNNAGAILVIGKNLLIVAKMIHPRPPLESSKDSPPENSWMVELNEKMPPTPPRGESKLEEGSSSRGTREVTIDDYLVDQKMEEFNFASSTNDDDKTN